LTYADYVGKSERREAIVRPETIERLAATLQCSLPAEGALPPLWHWMLFQDWKTPPELGKDGHPVRGGFLPPVHDLPRRIWGGSRIVFHAKLYAGDTATRVSTVGSVEERTGSTGRLVLVTVKHSISGVSGLVISEEQDIVYCEAIKTQSPRKRETPAPAPADATTEIVVPDSTLLFRFSALTGNAHRIHYDEPYARQEEGYAGLVVHGPLQAILLSNLAARLSGGRRLAIFRHRGHQPLIAGEPLHMEGWREGPAVKLRIRDRDGRICTSAEATFDSAPTRSKEGSP
jgi:3-methylfumaryl-CoA hydratase